MKCPMYATTPRQFKNGRPSSSVQPAIGLVLALAFCFSLNANAQNASQTKTTQPAASGAFFYPAPAKGFDPLVASDDELAQYGFPPRPKTSDAIPFARWKKLVTSPQTRLSDLTVKATNVIHGKARNWQEKGIVANTNYTTSDNWSAYAVTDSSGTFKANDSYIYAEWNIPAVGVENCSYSPYMSSQWIGFDGAYGSYDVLQAGTEVDGCPANYYAWYEWFTDDCTVNSASQPCYSYELSFPVSPGDLIVAEVWYTTTAPNGHAYLYNYTQQEAASVAFNQPSTIYSPANYSGNGVEWVVERPDEGIYNLTNYIADQFNWTLAYDGSGYFYPGTSPSGSTTYNISMTCPAWDPSSSCTSSTDISVVDLFGDYTLWFYDEGPAYQ
jgi:hypothetical protein